MSPTVLPYIGAVILTVGAVARFSAARNLSSHVDEAATILASERIADRGVPILPSGALYLQGATLSYLLAPLHWLGADPLTDLTIFRLPSVAAGTAALLLMFRLGLVLTGRAAMGVLGALLLMLDPPSVRWSGLARMYGLLQAISLALVLFFLHLLRRRAGPWRVVLFIALFAVAVFTNVAVALFLPPMALVAVLLFGRRLWSDRRDLAVALIGCAFAPLLLVFLNQLARPPGQPVRETTVGFAFVGDVLLSTEQLRRPAADAWLALFEDLPVPAVMPLLLIGATGFLVGAWSVDPGFRSDWTMSRRAMLVAVVILYWMPVTLVTLFVTNGQDRYLLHVHPLGLLILVLLVNELAGSARPAHRFRPLVRRTYPEAFERSATPELVGPGEDAQHASALSADEGVLKTRFPVPGAVLRVQRTLELHGRMVHLLVLGAIVLVAGTIRISGLERLSLWLDEGFTALYARQPWPVALGFEGSYSPHPPLYFAVTKLAGVVAPEQLAGRIVSAFAGIASVVLIAAIARRLFGWRASAAAALVLALSPTHVFYSQEARMYAPLTCMIALSYLALVAYGQRPAWRWAALYAISGILALYLDYSAAFALLPQAVVIGFLATQHRRAVIPLLIASVAVPIAYLPWVPQAIATISAANQIEQRDVYLGAGADRIVTAVLGIVGLTGLKEYLPDSSGLVWDAWPASRPLLLLLMGLIVALGIAALARQQTPLAALVIGSLSGTVFVAIWVSLVLSPALAVRTVLPALLGWALLVGAAMSQQAALNGRRLAWLGLAGLMVVSSLGARTIGNEAIKQPWREAAADLAFAASIEAPVITFSYGHVADILVSIYEPALIDRLRIISVRDGEQEEVLGNGHLPERGLTLADVTSGQLSTAIGEGQSEVPYVWFLYYVRTGIVDVQTAIESLGYERVWHRQYGHDRLPIYLDLYASDDGTPPGQALDVNGDFANGAAGWTLPSSPMANVSEEQGRQQLVISGDESDPVLAMTEHTAGPGLYDVTVETRSIVAAQPIVLTLVCIDAQGTSLRESRVGSREGWATTAWQRQRVAVVCPEGTQTIRISIGIEARGEVAFRNLNVRYLTRQ